jgi:hypothetical protein
MEINIYEFSNLELNRRVKMAVFWVVASCSLVEIYQRFRGPCCLHHHGALMLEAARSSEMTVNFYQTTWRYNPENSHLRTNRHENLKSYQTCVVGQLHTPIDFNLEKELPVPFG